MKNLFLGLHYPLRPRDLYYPGPKQSDCTIKGQNHCFIVFGKQGLSGTRKRNKGDNNSPGASWCGREGEVGRAVAFSWLNLNFSDKEIGAQRVYESKSPRALSYSCVLVVLHLSGPHLLPEATQVPLSLSSLSSERLKLSSPFQTPPFDLFISRY